MACSVLRMRAANCCWKLDLLNNFIDITRLWTCVYFWNMQWESLCSYVVHAIFLLCSLAGVRGWQLLFLLALLSYNSGLPACSIVCFHCLVQTLMINMLSQPRLLDIQLSPVRRNTTNAHRLYSKSKRCCIPSVGLLVSTQIDPRGCIDATLK